MVDLTRKQFLGVLVVLFVHQINLFNQPLIRKVMKLSVVLTDRVAFWSAAGFINFQSPSDLPSSTELIREIDSC